MKIFNRKNFYFFLIFSLCGFLLSPLSDDILKNIISLSLIENYASEIKKIKVYALPFLIFFASFTAGLNFTPEFFSKITLSEIKKSSIYFFSAVIFQAIVYYLVLLVLNFQMSLPSLGDFIVFLAISMLLFPKIQKELSLFTLNVDIINNSKNENNNRKEDNVILFASFMSFLFLGILFSFFRKSVDSFSANQETIAISIIIAIVFYLLTYFAFENEAKIVEKIFFVLLFSVVYVYIVRILNLSLAFGGFLIGLMFSLFSGKDEKFFHFFQLLNAFVLLIIFAIYLSFMNFFVVKILPIGIFFSLLRILATALALHIAKKSDEPIFESNSKFFYYFTGLYPIVFFFDYGSFFSEFIFYAIYSFIFINLAISLIMLIFIKCRLSKKFFKSNEANS